MRLSCFWNILLLYPTEAVEKRKLFVFAVKLSTGDHPNNMLVITYTGGKNNKRKSEFEGNDRNQRAMCCRAFTMLLILLQSIGQEQWPNNVHHGFSAQGSASSYLLQITIYQRMIFLTPLSSNPIFIFLRNYRLRYFVLDIDTRAHHARNLLISQPPNNNKSSTLCNAI